MAEQNNSGIPEKVVGVLLLLFIACGFWFGFEIGKHRTRIHAIRAGAGEFYISDRESLNGDFRWKTNTIAVTNTVFILK